MPNVESRASIPYCCVTKQMSFVNHFPHELWKSSGNDQPSSSWLQHLNDRVKYAIPILWLVSLSSIWILDWRERLTPTFVGDSNYNPKSAFPSGAADNA